MLLAPASLTKLMTAYVIFNALQQEQITLEDVLLLYQNIFYIDANYWKQTIGGD